MENEELTTNETTDPKKTEQKLGFAEKMKRRAKELSEQAGQGMQNLGEKARELADKGADLAKTKTEELGEQLHRMKYEYDKERISPVTLEDIASPSFDLPNVIRVFEDEKVMDNEVCENAVGFIDKIKDMSVLNLRKKDIPSITALQLVNGPLYFYPIVTENLYYNDPYDDNRYVALDNYFSLLKKAKLNELERIAYDLGAKRVTIKSYEEKKSFVNVKVKNKQGAGAKIEGQKATAEVEAAAEGGVQLRETTEIDKDLIIDNPGEPVRPKLQFYANDDDINNLIYMRLDGKGDLYSKTYMLKYSTTSGINVKTAHKIDAAISHYKYKSNTTVAAEVEKENKLFLKYVISFK